MKTTADLPLTQYQRGQLAHIHSLSCLEAKSSAATPLPPTDQRQNGLSTEHHKKRKQNEPRGLEFEEARSILITALQSFQEEERLSTGHGTLVSESKQPPPTQSNRKPLPLKQPQRPSDPDNPPQKQIGKITDAHPTDRKVPPAHVAQQPRPLDKTEDTTKVPLQLLAMTEYSQARCRVERKRKELQALFDQSGDPTQLVHVQQQVAKLKPELQQALDLLDEAEERLKSIVANNK